MDTIRAVPAESDFRALGVKNCLCISGKVREYDDVILALARIHEAIIPGGTKTPCAIVVSRSADGFQEAILTTDLGSRLRPRIVPRPRVLSANVLECDRRPSPDWNLGVSLPSYPRP